MLRKIKNYIFKDYSPDVAFRYLPAVDILKKKDLENCRLLEVGSGGLGITPYFKKKITGLDIVFGDKQSDLLKKVKYDGGRFPFSDNEFDLILSVDSFEHIRPDKRQAALNEMLRTATTAIIMIVPCGRAASKNDIELSEFYKKIHGRSDSWFDDHIKNGLPKEDKLRNMFLGAAMATNKNVVIKVQKLTNISIRRAYMRLSIRRGIAVSFLYYCFLFLLPLRGFLNFGECYRRIFIIKIKSNEGL